MGTVTTPALAAAFRLATTQPVRTHVRQYHERRFYGQPDTNLPVYRRAQIREWMKTEMQQQDMAARLGISQAAVSKHVKAINAEARNGPPPVQTEYVKGETNG